MEVNGGKYFQHMSLLSSILFVVIFAIASSCKAPLKLIHQNAINAEGIIVCRSTVVDISSNAGCVITKHARKPKYLIVSFPDMRGMSLKYNKQSIFIFVLFSVKLQLNLGLRAGYSYYLDLRVG